MVLVLVNTECKSFGSREVSMHISVKGLSARQGDHERAVCTAKRVKQKVGTPDIWGRQEHGLFEEICQGGAQLTQERSPGRYNH